MPTWAIRADDNNKRDNAATKFLKNAVAIGFFIMNFFLVIHLVMVKRLFEHSLLSPL